LQWAYYGPRWWNHHTRTFYANYNGFSTASGVTVVPVISTIETGFALPAVADFETNYSKTKAILICNPGNWLDIYIQKEIMQLAALVKKNVCS
jgi:aspartate aminotransferase